MVTAASLEPTTFSSRWITTASFTRGDFGFTFLCFIATSSSTLASARFKYGLRIPLELEILCSAGDRLRDNTVCAERHFEVRSHDESVVP